MNRNKSAVIIGLLILLFGIGYAQESDYNVIIERITLKYERIKTVSKPRSQTEQLYGASNILKRINADESGLVREFNRQASFKVRLPIDSINKDEDGLIYLVTSEHVGNNLREIRKLRGNRDDAVLTLVVAVRGNRSEYRVGDVVIIDNCEFVWVDRDNITSYIFFRQN
jgi:hypothetical protein